MIYIVDLESTKTNSLKAIEGDLTEKDEVEIFCYKDSNVAKDSYVSQFMLCTDAKVKLIEEEDRTENVLNFRILCRYMEASAKTLHVRLFTKQEAFVKTFRYMYDAIDAIQKAKDLDLDEDEFKQLKAPKFTKVRFINEKPVRKKRKTKEEADVKAILRLLTNSST